MCHVCMRFIVGHVGVRMAKDVSIVVIMVVRAFYGTAAESKTEHFQVLPLTCQQSRLQHLCLSSSRPLYHHRVPPGQKSTKEKSI